MKKLLLFLLIFNFQLSAFNSFGQTNVSGGIYANTTWTLAGSPYIVVDTVVVFPGITLTIEPGVVVKFDDNMRLEIRGSSLIANGTMTDSIIFTSNSGTPTPGIWSSVYLNNILPTNLNFCSFYYAESAISLGNNGNDLVIKNSNFQNNYNGYYFDSYGPRTNIDSCTFRNNTFGLNCPPYGTYTHIEHCTISNNQTGLYLSKYSYVSNSIIDSNSVQGIHTYMLDTIINCEIKYNGNGLVCWAQYVSSRDLVVQNIIENNNIGIYLLGWADSITCNKICGNISYDLYNDIPWGNNANVKGNYWCTTDSVAISLQIYDGYDNINLALADYTPFDTVGCYLTGCNMSVTAIVSNATCDTCPNGSATAHIANGFAPYSYTWYTSPIQITQTATALAPGTYTVCVTDAHGCTACNNNVYVDSTNCTGFGVNAVATNATCSLCSDGTATAAITAGTPPYYYTWYTVPIQTTQTATGLTAGTYSVCVNDVYGCAACDTVIVGIGSCSAYYTIYADTTPHTYDLVNMASGTPPLTYDWNWGDGSPHDTAAYPSHTYATSGNYTICLSITDSAGCTNSYCHAFYLMSPMSSQAVTVNVIPPTSTGIHVNTDEKLFSISPNPATDYLTLHFAGSVALSQIRIINLLGEIKYSSLITGTETNLNVSALAQGIYFIEVSSGNKVSRERFVKQ